MRVNISDRLTEMAAVRSGALAIVCPRRYVRSTLGGASVRSGRRYASITFAGLETEVSYLARGLMVLGVEPGMRVALLVRPGIEFVALVFALLRCGAVIVLADPGIGRRHLINCLGSTEPQGFIAVPKAQITRGLLRHRFPAAWLNVTVGGPVRGARVLTGGRSLDDVRELGKASRKEFPETLAADPAAIIFTSGSTGPPKGVLALHRTLEAQVSEIEREYAIRPGAVDLACFPLFALFNTLMGVTTVMPEMDASRPAAADPEKVLAAAGDWQVTQAFASPVLWDKLSRHCAETGARIPSLRKVFSCGAPVPAKVLRRTLSCVHPRAQMHTPFGATEALPVATIEAHEVLGETASQTDRGAGICVGKVFPSLDCRVIRITDEPLAALDEAEELPPGEVGELVVRGPQVSPHYVNHPAGNAAAKMAADDPTESREAESARSSWHRMGDVGYFDEQGRFWYCGRKAHRVQSNAETLYTVCTEAIFNTHPHVARTALVGVGPALRQTPVLVIEPEASLRRWYFGRLGRYAAMRGGKPAAARAKLAADLFELGQQHPASRGVRHFLFRGRLPVDVRHNSKILREALARWAAARFDRSLAVGASD